jgi:peroxiredoxin
MQTHKIVAFIAILFLSASMLAAPPTAVPRRSPEFTISEPSGKATLLSSFQGRVVVIEFLFVKSPHCLRVTMTLNKLYQELGPRGFQPIGIVFDPPGPPGDVLSVTYLVDYLKLTYPVGYTSKDSVDRFLDRGESEILRIPQIVVIDRAGMIRATSGTRGEPNLENESSLRNLLETLLQEPIPKPIAKKASSSLRQ